MTEERVRVFLELSRRLGDVAHLPEDLETWKRIDDLMVSLQKLLYPESVE